MEEIQPQQQPDQQQKTTNEECLKVCVKCPRCDKEFYHQRSLDAHIKHQIKKTCIGVWFVCKRCLKAFDQNADLYRHQTSSTCKKFNPSEKLITGNVPPPELTNKMQVLKCATECQGIENYIEHAVERRDKIEIMNALEGMSLSELNIMLSTIEKKGKHSYDNYTFLDNLMALSEYSNLPSTSTEKKAIIKKFVLENTCL